MIQFNKCEITQDGKNLIVNASVKDLSYYEDVLIGAITIDNQDTYSASGPSSNYVYHKDFDGSDDPGGIQVKSKPYQGGVTEDDTDSSSTEVKGQKSIDITISVKEFNNQETNLNDDILYVYLKAVGTPSADTPCGQDNEYTMAIAVNLGLVYTKGIDYIKQTEGSCEIPKDFINFILEYKALDLSLKTGNYIQANKYWNKFFKGDYVSNIKTSGCGCS